MEILIFIIVIIILSSISLGIYSLFIDNISLLISSLSVVASSISGLIAVMVLKESKEQKRPFIIIQPGYKRYGVVQITIKNYGSEIAIIGKSDVNREIKLLKGQNYFEQIKGIVIAPNENVTFDLMLLKDYKSLNKNYTVKGTIQYKNINGKEFKNDILFSIENLEAMPYTDSEKQQMFFKLQGIPKELNKITKELEKIKNTFQKTNNL